MPFKTRDCTFYMPCYAADPRVKENAFRIARPDRSFPPNFPESRELLPAPFWDGHDSAIAGYWKVWDLAFRNLRRVLRGNGFIKPYIDTAFNDCLFLWDSVFILMFARYGRRAFDFQATLDNLYAKQHDDGFITRELTEWDGQDRFHRHDPSSTGPNLLAWSEWEYFRNFGDRERLAAVFPVLLAYHDWMRRYRSWQDGSYWTTGWGCGMDSQPRPPADCVRHLEHGFMSWIDATAQAALSARLLVQMAETLGRGQEVDALRREHAHLHDLINRTMWDERRSFYVDRFRDGSLSSVKSIGAYWTVLAGLVPQERLAPLLAHLDDEATFNRPHRVPSLPADHAEYDPQGGYWLGGVWPSTNYMIVRGLTGVGADDLAYSIGRSHHDNVIRVFEETGTFWENYAPESAAPGVPAKADFVGWGGIGPVAVFLEYVLGLRPDVPAGRLIWDVRQLEAHGVRRYPFGRDGVFDLSVQRRAAASDEPKLEATGNRPLEIELRWEGGVRIIKVLQDELVTASTAPPPFA